MTISTDGFRIPVTVQLDARTYRAIHSAAQRASSVAKREVTIRELIELRLAEAVTGVTTPRAPRPPREPQVVRGKEPRGNRLNAEALELLTTMARAGATGSEIAKAVGCTTATVAYHRKKIRVADAKGASNV